jgi:UTP--glucose-1-phosphate uridylyltransferase
VSRYGIIHGEKWAPRLHRIRQLVEKPAPDVAPSNLAVIGRYVLPPVIFEFLEDVQRDGTGEIQLTDALARLAREKALIGYVFEGVRHDTGDRLGFITANIAYALRRPELKDKLWDYLESLERT